MSERSVIFSVATAVVLLLVWIGIDLIGHQPDEPARMLLTLDPAEIERIELHAADGSLTRIAREDFLGLRRWMIRWGEGGTDQAWPADETRVRAGLRVLATTAVDPGMLDGVFETTLTIHASDGSTQTIRFGDQPVAGRIGVIVDSGGQTTQGLTDATLYDAFVRTDLRTWRDMRPFAPPGVGPSAITLESQARSLSLGRRQGRWSVLEPVFVAADPDAASELAKTIASLRAERFFDSLAIDDAQLGLTQPLAHVIVEHDVRALSNATETTLHVRQSMLVGQPTDLSGRSVYALVEWTVRPGLGDEQPLVGPTLLSVPTEALNRLTTRPDGYVSRTSLEMLAASIDRIRLSVGSKSVEIERRSAGWSRKTDPLVPADSELVDKFITLLTRRHADDVVVAEAEVDNPEALRIELMARGDLKAAELRATASVDPAGMWIASGLVGRFYAGMSDLAAELISIVERLGTEQ